MGTELDTDTPNSLGSDCVQRGWDVLSGSGEGCPEKAAVELDLQN